MDPLSPSPTPPAAPPLHHLALGARDVALVSEFYRDVLGLPELQRHHDDGGGLRSVWLGLGGALLMVERTEQPLRSVDGVGAGPFLLALAVDAAGRAALEARLVAAGRAIESRTAWTSYTRDPEGNRVAVSCYPRPEF